MIASHTAFACVRFEGRGLYLIEFCTNDFPCYVMDARIKVPSKIKLCSFAKKTVYTKHFSIIQRISAVKTPNKK